MRIQRLQTRIIVFFVALLALRPRLAPTALHSAADIEAALGLPVIAQLPGRRTRAA